MKAIMTGEADMMFQDLYVARNLLQSPRYEKLVIFPAYEVPQDMKLVMLKEQDPMLMSILSKTVDSVNKDGVDDIVRAHTVAEPYKVTLKDTYYKYKVLIWIIDTLVFLVIGLLALNLIARRRNEKQIIEKNLELESAYRQTIIASKAKGDFLARMSHEIRTPMNAIIGLTVLAEDHIADPTVTSEYLEKIEFSSKILLSIINDVLDMSSIESGKMHISHEQFNVSQLLSSLTSVYYTQCKAKGVAYSTKLLGEIDEMLVGDSLRLNQIFMNLLSNAVKFTDNGAICLTVEQRSVQSDRLYLHINVEDTGSGMSEDMKNRLWEPFEPSDATTAREHGGSGLGLAIVKNLVTLYW